VVNRGEEKVRVHMNVVPRSTKCSLLRSRYWGRYATLLPHLVGGEALRDPTRDPNNNNNNNGCEGDWVKWSCRRT